MTLRSIHGCQSAPELGLFFSSSCRLRLKKRLLNPVFSNLTAFFLRRSGVRARWVFVYVSQKENPLLSLMFTVEV